MIFHCFLCIFVVYASRAHGCRSTREAALWGAHFPTVHERRLAPGRFQERASRGGISNAVCARVCARGAVPCNGFGVGAPTNARAASDGAGGRCHEMGAARVSLAFSGFRGRRCPQRPLPSTPRDVRGGAARPLPDRAPRRRSRRLRPRRLHARRLSAALSWRVSPRRPAAFAAAYCPVAPGAALPAALSPVAFRRLPGRLPRRRLRKCAVRSLLGGAPGSVAPRHLCTITHTRVPMQTWTRCDGVDALESS